MPFPIILGWLAISALAGGGIAAGASGIADMKKAKEIADAAMERHQNACRRLDGLRASANLKATEYGRQKVAIRRSTMKRWLSVLEALEKKAAQALRERLASFEVSLDTTVEEFRQQVLDADVFAKSVGSALTGAAAGASAYAAVGLLGTAGTGAAITGLSGAAAHSAVLAWLGGGSIAAGGGGMAAGAAVLGGIVVAPALVITGLVLASKGEKALTDARKFEAETNVQIQKADSMGTLLNSVAVRIGELSSLSAQLDERAQVAIGQVELLLKSRKFNPRDDRHVHAFQSAYNLAVALSEVMKVAILEGSDGRLSGESGNVVVKYRDLVV